MLRAAEVPYLPSSAAQFSFVRAKVRLYPYTPLGLVTPTGQVNPLPSPFMCNLRVSPHVPRVSPIGRPVLVSKNGPLTIKQSFPLILPARLQSRKAVSGKATWICLGDCDGSSYQESTLPTQNSFLSVSSRHRMLAWPRPLAHAFLVTSV